VVLLVSEKLEKNIQRVSEEFKKRGFSLEEDLRELLEMREDIAKMLEETKFKKIEFFVEGENSIGFTLEDAQITFTVETGEDEEGPWYEADAHILLF
jgi:gamma-glutamylcysteine synthetase